MSKAITNLKEIFNLLGEKKKANPLKSYTASLYQKGDAGINRKIMEEAFELTQAKKKIEVIREFSDLLYHSFVLLQHKNITYREIEKEMLARTGISGLVEKKNRLKK